MPTEGAPAASPVTARLDALQAQLEAIHEQIAGLRGEMLQQPMPADETKTGSEKK